MRPLGLLLACVLLAGFWGMLPEIIAGGLVPVFDLPGWLHRAAEVIR